MKLQSAADANSLRPRNAKGHCPCAGSHTVKEARAQGWDTLSDGDLLDAAEDAGFDVLLTTDKNLRHQQNLQGRKLAIVVLSKSRWSLVSPLMEQIVVAVNAAKPGSYALVDIPVR